MASMTVDLGKVLKEKCVVTVRFKMPKGWKIRFWLGGWLICLGARIAGLGYKETDAPKEKLIDDLGIHFCAFCREYDEHALQNCALGYAAPSDCPKAREKVLAMLEMTK